MWNRGSVKLADDRRLCHKFVCDKRDSAASALSNAIARPQNSEDDKKGGD